MAIAVISVEFGASHGHVHVRPGAIVPFFIINGLKYLTYFITNIGE